MSDVRKHHLRELIGRVESNGNYNIMVGGKKVPLTKMTVGEVLAYQGTLKGDTAAGKYQIKEDTLKSLVFKPGKEAGTYSDELRNPSDFNLDTPFDEAAQDWAADVLIDRRGYKDYAQGKITDVEMAKKLSEEWASLPNPELGERVSTYAGDGKHDRETQVSASQVLKTLNVVEASSGKLKSKPDPMADGSVPRPEPIQSGGSGPTNGQDPLVSSGLDSQRPEWQGGQGLLRGTDAGYGPRYSLGQALRTSR